MPATPEFRDAAGKVGAAEVDGEMKAKEFGHADGHVGVAGEIEEDLEGESDGAGPCVEDAGVSCRSVEVGITELGKVVGKSHLFSEAEDKEEDAAGDVIAGGFGPGGEVGEELFGAYDGASNELGEEGEEEGVVYGIADGLLLAAVDIDDVGHALKDVKADPDGENDFDVEAVAE